MPFWNTDRIEKEWDHLVAEGGDRARVLNCSYELALGPEVFITTDNTKTRLEPGGQVTIPPGQMALLLTEEFIAVPTNVLAFISIKFTYKSRGLVNISGFHVDPGFRGRLVFSVYNASPRAVPLTRGAPVFIIWYCSIDGEPSRAYQGAHQGQSSITDSMVRDLQGRISSPAALQEQIDGIAKDLAHTRWLAAFVGLLLGAVFSGVLVPMVGWAAKAAEGGTLAFIHLLLAFLIGFVLSLIVLVLLRKVMRPIGPQGEFPRGAGHSCGAMLRGYKEWFLSLRQKQPTSRGAQRRPPS